MTDARRQEHEPDETAATGPSPDPPSAPEPDAIGAWPEGDAERAAMPDQRAADEAEATAGPAEANEDAEDRSGSEVSDDPSGAEVSEDPRSREELLEALRETETQRDDYLDGVQRARAEFENYRKRTMREGASQREAGKAEVADGLLEVLDDLDRTLEAAEVSEDESLARGVQLVAEKLVATLRAAGLERVDETGVAFDPNRHEAVQQREAEETREEPVVSQVLRPGYALGDRVLRAAMVVVEQ